MNIFSTKVFTSSQSSIKMFPSIQLGCLIVLLASGTFSSVASQDTSSSGSSSSSSSSSSGGARVQQVQTATPEPESPYKLTSWDAFNSAIKMTAGIVKDPNACKPEIMEKTLACYNDYTEKWDHGGTEKKFCCFAQDVLDCFYKMVPSYCDATGTEAYLSSDKQQLIFYSASKDVCGSYHSFWHCDNGIPIVVGATCGALVVIVLVVVGVIIFLRKRKGSSSLRSDNL